jgi:sulfotransferase family protein
MDDLYPPQTIAAGLAALARRWPAVQSTSEQQPVFVLAAGWRSGSTLLQRALMSHCLVWGEPFGHAGLLERLADPLRAVNERWPEPHFVYRGEPVETLAGRFVANLYPPPEHLLQAYLAWFEAGFARPARAAGKERWGIKEVRLSADHATFLRWLYPHAKFLFVIRNPYDAFRSFAARRDHGWSWYHRWPDHPVTPELFGRHWRELAGSFLAAGEALGGLIVRYERLDRDGWDAIRNYVGLELSEKAIGTNPPDGGPPPLAAFSPPDLELLRAEVEPLAGELGYQVGGQGSGLRAQREAERESGGETERQRGSQAESRARSVAPSLRPSVAPAPRPPQLCAVLVPVAEKIEPACEAALRELERRGYRVWRVHGYKQIDLGRCQMASDALAAGCQEALWIDADTGFHPDMVERLRAHDLPIVCGIYPKKSKRELAIHVLPGTKEIQFGTGGGLIELLYAPTGFLLVRREVYDKLREQLQLPECLADTGRTLVPYYAPLIRPDGDGWWYLADDFAFCERARQCGYKIMADTTIRLLHIGSYAFGWEDAGRQVPRFSSYLFHLTDQQQKGEEA